LREGIAPVRDRLVMTIFLAVVVHGIIILGLTFGAGASDADDSPGLPVLLVSDEVPAAERNDSATYLAQRTQLGSGKQVRALPPHQRATPAVMPSHDGVEEGTSLSRSGQARGGEDERVLVTTAPKPDIRYVTDAGEQVEGAERPLLTHVAAEAPGPDKETDPGQLRGPRRDELWVTPDTREAALAPYVDSWRRRVERIEIDYPAIARRAGVQASPVLDVAIAADGKLEKVQIRRSSGYPDLDQAALEVLKLASPFDPFPPELARETRTLHVVYEYQFVGGRLAAGTVSAIP